MMAIVKHITSGSGLRKFQADGFLSDGVLVRKCNSVVQGLPCRFIIAALVRKLISVIKRYITVVTASLSQFSPVNHVHALLLQGSL
jgi:hypothetical protein